MAALAAAAGPEMMDHRPPPMAASGHAAVVATLVTGANGGGGGRQRVQHRCVSVAEHAEYAAATPSQLSPQPRRHPQQIEVRGPSFVLHHFDFDDPN